MGAVSSLNRGIQNTHVRFQRAQDARTLSARIAQGTQSDTAVSDAFNAQRRRAQREALRAQALEELAHEHNMQIDAEDLKITARNIPKEEPFPIFIFLIALMKDMVDLIANLSFFGIFLIWVGSFFMSVVLFLWFLGKMQGKWWKKRMLTWAIRRALLALALESMPIFSIIPATTILVIMTHNRETKIVRMLSQVLETLHSHRLTPAR
jgi:hypothetical protein